MQNQIPKEVAPEDSDVQGVDLNANIKPTEQSEGLSPGDLSAIFHSVESLKNWASPPVKEALEAPQTSKLTPANQPNTANSPQLVTIAVDAVKSFGAFVNQPNKAPVSSEPPFRGGIEGGVRRPVDPSPNAQRNVDAARAGTASHTKFRDSEGNTIHVLRTPAPYYKDSQGNQQLLELGKPAPKDARYAYYNAYQETFVSELKGEELGLLKNISGPNDFNLSPLRVKVEEQNRQSATARFGSPEAARQISVNENYYGSPPHRAAAEAASVRVGGRIPADWFMKQDPFLGRAGSNNEYAPYRSEGLYPGNTSRIGVAHDTDFGLGANFKAGPLRDLHGKSNPSGLEGLTVMREISGKNPASVPKGTFSDRAYDSYLGGHVDWYIDNVRGKETEVNKDFKGGPYYGSFVPLGY